MKNILADRIKEAKLTKTQLRIADYFIANQERIGSLSSLEAAHEIGVSDASIIRFSRAIGFDGFADLKAQIYDMLVENSLFNLSLTERMEKSSEKYKDGDLTAQFQKLAHQDMLSAFRGNSPESFQRTADALVHASQRYVIGLRGCRGTALSFGRLLSFMLPGVHCLIDDECSSISQMQDITENDVLIMFVFRRYYKIDIAFLELARQKGAAVCLVQTELTSPLSSYADIILTVASDSITFFNSNIGMMVTAEYILALIGRQVAYHDRVEQRDAITEIQRL